MNLLIQVRGAWGMRSLAALIGYAARSQAHSARRQAVSCDAGRVWRSGTYGSQGREVRMTAVTRRCREIGDYGPLNDRPDPSGRKHRTCGRLRGIPSRPIYRWDDAGATGATPDAAGLPVHNAKSRPGLLACLPPPPPFREGGVAGPRAESGIDRNRRPPAHDPSSGESASKSRSNSSSSAD